MARAAAAERSRPFTMRFRACCAACVALGLLSVWLARRAARFEGLGGLRSTATPSGSVRRPSTLAPVSIRYPPNAVPTARLRRCRWPTARRSRQAEVNTTVASVLDQFLTFLEDEVRGRLMYEYTLRDGSLLGALRHGGLIPGDRDLDAVVLLPENDSLAGFRAACDGRLEALGR
eukprot:6897930-Prymnesium_polylepis.1